MEGIPIANQAIATGTPLISTASTVPRWNVVSGSPLTFTSTFHVPCTTAAASARPIATGITEAQCRTAAGPGEEWHNPIGGGGVTRPYFEPLVGIDTWFLFAERHEAPLHIGATYIFEGTPRVKGGRGALGLSRTIEERLHLVPRYRQKLMWPPGGIGNPVWVDDADFDLSYHVRRAALPSPGDDDTLREYVARVFARPLDLNKPLWEMTVIEGLTGGRVAVVNKVHHAMVDGISTVDLATLLLDPTPDQPKLGRPKRWRPRPAPTQSDLLRDAGFRAGQRARRHAALQARQPRQRHGRGGAARADDGEGPGQPRHLDHRGPEAFAGGVGGAHLHHARDLGAGDHSEPGRPADD